MSHTGKEIHIEEGESEVTKTLELNLLNSLSQDLEQANNTSFTLSIKDESNVVIAGLVASTSYSWLLIKILWVDETQRNKGFAKALMQRAESRGRELQCHSVWLDTSNPNAMEFYLKLGYKPFGELQNSEDQFPASHQRWFMKKSLALSEC